MKLARKGVELSDGRERHLLERTAVRKAVLTDVPTVALPATVGDARARLDGSSHDWVIVVDGEGRLQGVVTRERLTEEAAADGGLEALATAVPPITRYQSLDVAFRRLAPRGLRMLPVIDAASSRIVLGAVTRDSLMAAYWSHLIDEQRPKEPLPKTPQPRDNL
ncbi:MAG TPA: CBS domain-containing protein [Actinomycetota bacterium]